MKGIVFNILSSCVIVCISCISLNAQIVNPVFKDTLHLKDLDSKISAHVPVSTVYCKDSVSYSQLVNITDSGIYVYSATQGIIRASQLDSLNFIPASEIDSLTYFDWGEVTPASGRSSLIQLGIAGGAATIINLPIQGQVSFRGSFFILWSSLFAGALILTAERNVEERFASFAEVNQMKDSRSFRKLSVVYSELPDSEVKDEEIIYSSDLYRKRFVDPKWAFAIGGGASQFHKGQGIEETIINTGGMLAVGFTPKGNLSYELGFSAFYHDFPFEVSESGLVNRYGGFFAQSLSLHSDYSLLKYHGIRTRKFDVSFGAGLVYSYVYLTQTLNLNVPGPITLERHKSLRMRTHSGGVLLRLKATRYMNSWFAFSIEWQQRMQSRVYTPEVKLKTTNLSGPPEGFDQKAHSIGGSFVLLGFSLLLF